MRKYLSSDVGQLAHQLTLSPRRLRLSQLDGVETLLGMVDPEKAYPYELICYTITGYHPKASERPASIPGEALVADLVTLADHLSRKAKLTTAELNEPFQTHEELADTLGVSTKTVRRWRSRGLTGIRAVFDDGVGRTVFRRRSVDRFVKQNRELVERGAAFRQLTDAEKADLVDAARGMLERRRTKLCVVARELASRTGRAVETVRYTLRRWDETHPDDALFAGDGRPVLSERDAAILRWHDSGETPREIAATVGCAVDTVKRALREHEARGLSDTRVEYIYNELFDAPNADRLILEAPEPAPPERTRTPRPPRDLPAYLRALYDTPLLSPEQERDLFRRYNYLKYKAARRLEALDALSATDQEVAEIRTLLRHAGVFKKRIISANLRLVVSIAKRHVGGAANFFEVVSDGNVSLLRAIEKFDFARGNKLSTYASWAIMKNYARTVPEEHYHCRRYVTGQAELLDATQDHHPAPKSEVELEGVRSALAESLEDLDERERTIVTEHYGLFGQGPAKTLEQLGRRFGVTKERVRQIEKRALGKIRLTLAPVAADLLAD
ncbi:MAG: sigma-70 family RNA polymerase sigma factor [bacterium]|nr:sigma-70 family RNA polymerase sigma factor [bacterium]